MPVADQNRENDSHAQRKVVQFGGCAQLLQHYRTIGVELLRLEASTSYLGGSLYFTEDSHGFSSFRRGVSFVPVEVLESYRDDLLDLNVLDETLGIKLEGFSLRAVVSHLPWIGFLVAIGAGLYTTSLGGSPLLSFALTLSLATPFAVLWHLCPRGAARRMRFAQVLSHEISRRRGDGRSLNQLPRFELSSLFGRRSAAGTTMRMMQ